MTSGSSSIRVVASLVDGGALEWAFGLEFLARLAGLERRGLKGKALIDALISDDWAAPPNVHHTISGADTNGRRIRRVIAYD